MDIDFIRERKNINLALEAIEPFVSRSNITKLPQALGQEVPKRIHEARALFAWMKVFAQKLHREAFTEFMAKHRPDEKYELQETEGFLLYRIVPKNGLSKDLPWVCADDNADFNKDGFPPIPVRLAELKPRDSGRIAKIADLKKGIQKEKS